MALDWSDIEDALHTWARDSSGLPDAQVVWADQNVNQPSGAHLVIRFGAFTQLGSIDAVRVLTDLDRDAGEEIEHRTQGVRELVVSVQAFSPATVGDATARSLLSRLQSSLALPGVREGLYAAGLACLEQGTVLNLAEVANADFQGRASLDVRFGLTDEASEFTGYIASTEVTNETTEETFTVDSES